MKCIKLLHFILPFVSAGLLLLSFPPFDFGWGAWIALIPLIWFSFKEISVRRSFLFGFLAGFCFQFGLHLYLLQVLTYYLPVPWGWVLLLLTASLLAFPVGIFSAGLTYFRHLLPLFLIPFFGGGLWAALEFIRSAGFFAHTGGFLGYSQWRYSQLLNIAAAYGYWGLPLIMAAAQVIVVLYYFERGARGHMRPAVIGLVVLFFAGLLLPELFPVTARSKPLNIALQQGNIPHYDVVSASAAEDNFAVYNQLNNSILQQEPRPDLIVMPETVVSFSLLDKNPEAEGKLQDFACEQGVDIFYGVMTKNKGGGNYNSVRLAAADGSCASYHKIRLVPFVEYFPWNGFLNRVLPLPMVIGSYYPGEKVTTFETSGSLVAANVCFESFFGPYALKAARKGAEHLFIFTNDAWFEGSGGMVQHIQAAAVRAAENGIGVTQAANTGITVSFDYRGRIIMRFPEGTRGSALLSTSFSRRATIYRWCGDAVAWMCLLMCIGISVFFIYKKNFSK